MRDPGDGVRTVYVEPTNACNLDCRTCVRHFDFPPCTDCGCELAETNEEDCLGNPHPTCGDCLWARGIVRCAWALRFVVVQIVTT